MNRNTTAWILCNGHLCTCMLVVGTKQKARVERRMETNLEVIYSKRKLSKWWSKKTHMGGSAIAI